MQPSVYDPRFKRLSDLDVDPVAGESSDPVGKQLHCELKRIRFPEGASMNPGLRPDTLTENLRGCRQSKANIATVLKLATATSFHVPSYS